MKNILQHVVLFSSHTQQHHREGEQYTMHGNEIYISSA